MNKEKPDLFAQFLQMMLVRAMEGESKIEERWSHGVETKFRVQLWQMLSVFAALCLGALGLWLIGGQLAWLMDLELLAGDYLLVSLALFSLLASGVAISSRVFRSRHRVVQSLFGLALALLVIVAVVAALNARRNEWTVWRAGGLVVGFALVVANAAWLYNQLNELVDPFGKTSPIERMIMPYLPVLFDRATTEPEPVIVRVREPVLVNSNGAELKPVERPDDPDLTAWEVDPLFEDLVWFVCYASEWGLSRSACLTKPRQRLPSVDPATGYSRILNRSRYEELLDEAARRGWIRRLGPGVEPEWTVPIELAVAQALTWWSDVAPDSPPPTPWQPGPGEGLPASQVASQAASLEEVLQWE